MARNDDPQSRVFKASDVHRRRVGKKAHSDKPTEQFEASGQLGQPAFEESSEGSESSVACEPDQSAVVLTPEFGHRSERQRQSDERWFAAMREGIPEVVPTQGEEGQVERAQVGQPMADQARRVSQPVSDQATHDEVRQPQASQSGADHVLESRFELASEPEAEPTFGPEPESEQLEPMPKPRPSAAGIAKGMSLRKRVAAIVAVVLVAIVVVAAAMFTWNRWYRFDDRADMQGEWYVVGTTVPVTIDDKAIHLTDDVTYLYEISTQDKTIHYVFGPMEGQGRYWFSDDRQYLVITDGDEFTSTGTAFDDLMYAFSDLPDRISGSDVKLPEGEGTIAFSREPDAQALAREKEEAAKKAAAEEAARKEEERRAAEEAEWEEYYEEEYYEEPVAEDEYREE